MQCKKCEYRLWNLPSRACPECGTSFRPSDYEFVINSIQFCCPHCEAQYYGTGEKGHLVPIAFGCASCGRHIHMDEMILLPTSGVEEEQTQVDKVPWLDRKQRGFVGGWWSTVGMALIHPARLMESAPDSSRVGEAWSFAVLTNMFAMSVGFSVFGLLSFFGVIFATGGASISAMLVGIAIGLLSGLLFATIGTLLLVAVWGAVAHGLLRLTGPTASSLDRTYQAICYSTGANIVTAVPFLGLYFGWIWWIISAILMLKAAQKVHGWRATVAVLFMPVSLIAVIVGLYALLLASVFSSAGGFRAALGGQTFETQTVAEALFAYADDHDGRFPDHGIELAAGDYLEITDLVAMTSGTMGGDVPVANTTLERFDALPDSQRIAILKAIVEAQPESVVAHRLGDFVFVYHGVDMNRCDPRLWITVLSLDPDVNPAPWANSGLIAMGQCDGSVRLIAGRPSADVLAAQNAVRAELGLPPLPEPWTVTHTKPAVEEPAPPPDVPVP